MILKITLLSTLFISALLALPMQAKEKATKKKLTRQQRILKLIAQEEKTIRSLRNLGPKLQWRLLELDTEKLKIRKENENKTFLDASYKLRKKYKKAWFFKSSKSLERSIRKRGLSLIKKFPQFRYRADIYYTLALNSRDYGNDKYTERYLKRSLKNSYPNSAIIHLSKTSLAEHYYNEKKYKRAIRYYTDVLNNKNDEWHSKHLYNVSWCYLKVKKHNKAIENAVLAYQKSKADQYIDVSIQVLESIGLFYVLAEREQEGADFYITNVVAPGKYMIKMANKTADNGSFPKADMLLGRALKNSMAKKNREEEVQLRLAQLDFFRNFKRFKRYFATANELNRLNKERPFSSDERITAVDKIKSLVGYLQLHFTRNSQASHDQHDSLKRKEIISYFDILSSINPRETDSYRFFQGETLFAVQMYEQALTKYRLGLEANKEKTPLFIESAAKTTGKKIDLKDKKKSEVLRRKIFDSMLASLENGRFKKSIRYNFTVYTYSNHTKLYPVDPRSQIIYRKLFNVYMKNIKPLKSLNVLTSYMKNYKEDQKVQRGMFTKIMDHYIKTKNTDKLSHWVNRLEKGFLSYDKKYVDQAIVILGKILFESYQKLEEQGKKQEAAEGYLSLYHNKKYPKQIKAKTAFKASLLYLETQKVEKSLKWAIEGLGLFSDKEAFKKRSQVLAISEQYFMLQNFKESESLSSYYLSKFCQKNFKEKSSLYINSVRMPILENNHQLAFKNQKKACGLKKSLQNELRQEIGALYLKNRQYKKFFSFYKKYKKEKSLESFFSLALLDIHWDSFDEKREKLTKSLEKIFKKEIAKAKKTSKEIRQMELILEFKAKRNPKNKRQAFTKTKKFDEALFNKELESRIAGLKELTAVYTPFIQSGYPRFILPSYKVLVASYLSLANSVSSFRPQGVPKEYQLGFTKAMQGVAKNLFSQARNYENTAIKLIKKNTILGHYNQYFLRAPKVTQEVGFRHPASQYVLPIDRQFKKINTALNSRESK